jgi:lipopolysaccharide/colanic/teichoic acid biosynthesis glycosyltransferase
MNLSQDETRLQESPRGNSVRVPRWKRVLDIACILVALPFLIPLVLFIAVMIKIRSAGPVVFSQERIGYLGRRFICLKFRTMVVGADTAVHHRHFSLLVGSNVPMVKLDSHGDPRLIPYGLLLRSSGLDELPQVINVLRGEMSLVGPRPCLPNEYDKYLPWQRERFNTLPGLTGLWQVSGKNKTTFNEMIHLDIHYARTKSLWLDLKIMLRTVPVLVVQVLERRRGIRRTSAPRSTEGGDLSSDDQSTAVTKRFSGSSSKQTVQSSTRGQT